ncbi:MAG: DUF3995 domain-containing protein [Bacilli bacterium]
MDKRQKLTARIAPAYAACAWAVVFAAASFYWASGGTWGVQTVGVDTLAQNPWFIIIVWITGALKAFAGLLALALVRPWGRIMPLWIPLTATWGAGVLFFLYGAANLAVRGLMALGILKTPDAMYSAAGYWHLLFWDPWWLIGGILFITAAWVQQRRSKTQP